MSRTRPFDVAVPTISTVVPRRGRTPKTVRHVSTLPFSLPVLEDHDAPTVASFPLSLQDTRKDLSPAYPSWMGWDLGDGRWHGLPPQDHLRASPRDFPAAPFCRVAGLADAVGRTFQDTKRFAAFANVSEPCVEPPEIDCTEALSTNAHSCLRFVADRMDEMFVVGDVVYVEIPGPVVSGQRNRIFNDFGHKPSFVSWDGVELLAPGVEREGLTVTSAVQPGISFALAVANGMTSVMGPWRLDLVGLTGDLVRAAGIDRQRLDLYDHAAVRDCVVKLHSATHGSKIVSLLKGCLDKGYFDADPRMAVERMSPDEELDRSVLGTSF